MKKLISLMIFVAIAAMVSCQAPKAKVQETPVTKKDLENEQAKYSYALGLDVSMNFKQRNMDVDEKFFLAGFKDGTAGKMDIMNEEEKGAALQEFQTKMIKKMQEDMTKKAAENKAKGEKFLEENKKKEGVKVTESGLQYKVITEGKGPKPTAEDMVECHYKGTLLDGTEFDSSYKRNQPAKFPLNRVIKGWTEGLQLMSKGAKYQFFIPSDLAYGERGNSRIGPGETLIFEVELINFEKAPANPQKPTVKPVKLPAKK